MQFKPLSTLRRRCTAAALALPLCALFGCAKSEDAGDRVTVGLLLPFTGSSSGTASNFERAAIYAADRINQGGGVGGKRLELLARDTHSELERSRRSTGELIAAGAAAVVGPESADIGSAIAPVLAQNRVLFLSPLVGAANERTVNCAEPWFRLAQSARALGEALAKELLASGVRRAAVLYAANSYDEALRGAASTRFSALGGVIELELELDPGAQSYSDVVGRVLAADVDAVVLATSPRTGALVVNEFYAVSPEPPRWFLSPLLKTELLVRNVVPAALEGAVGVAPKIYDTLDDFPDAFAARWQGDRPLEGAYFYYDAVALLALALEQAASAQGGDGFDAVKAALVDLAATAGAGVGWNEVELGLAQVRQGEDVYYSGLTGPLLLDACGSRRLGVTATWRVTGGKIVDAD